MDVMTRLDSLSPAIALPVSVSFVFSSFVLVAEIVNGPLIAVEIRVDVEEPTDVLSKSPLMTLPDDPFSYAWTSLVV